MRKGAERPLPVAGGFGGIMGILVSPSILAADFSNLGGEIARMEKAGADMLHIDVMDGVFVPNISFGLPVVKSIRKATNLFFDVHLMICNPFAYVERFAAAGADGITFHLESQSEPEKVIEKIRAAGKKVGVSVRPATPASAVLPLLDKIDMLLVMTVEPGFGGQSFMAGMLEKIRAVREYAAEHKIPLDIQVDGGINGETARLAAEAGANVMVAGSYLFRNGDAGKAVASLRG